MNFEPSVGSALLDSIASKEAPVIGNSLRELMQVTADDSDASVMAVSQLVLRDPGLTAKVLRQANSVMSLRSGAPRVATVSRAVIMLGVDEVRSVVATSLLLQASETPGVYPERTRAALERALHAAVQAKQLGLARGCNKEHAERLFISGLFRHLGELALWAHGGTEADRLEDYLCAGVPQPQAMRRVLGTTAEEFNERLLQAWGLHALDEPEIMFGARVAEAVGQGWQSASMQAVVADLAKHQCKTEAEVLDDLRRNLQSSPFRDAVKIAALLDDASGHPPPWTEPDAKLQLQIVADMLRLRRSRNEVPKLIGLCLEGLHRAVGLDRVAFAMPVKEQQAYVSRVAFGVQAERLKTQLPPLPLSSAKTQLFDKGIQTCTKGSLLPGELTPLIDQGPFLLGPVTTSGPVGFFYADRLPSGRALDDDTTTGFRLLVEQFETVLKSMAV